MERDTVVKDKWKLIKTEIVYGNFLQKVCENIYELVKCNDGTVSKTMFLEDLEMRGILADDPRVSEMIAAMKDFESFMDKNSFIQCVSKNITVIESAFTNSNIIHDFDSFTQTIREIYHAAKINKSGKMADYIPQLKKQDPDNFGVSICTIDGQRCNIGDANVDFCIQSCCKPMNYCLAVEEHGADEVHNYVGREPSGVRFNALKINKEGLPHNPLINSGAIMMMALIKRHLQPADRFDYVLDSYRNLAGGQSLRYSNAVYLSERRTGDRNFALAHFMRENKAFPADVNITDVLEFYFQACSLCCTANQLAIIAASLANGGTCPLTGIQVFSPETVKHCLSLMYSCGMYDYSGEFAFSIGLPAKSGVAGGVFVVIPNVMGICTFSPLLDQYGNSTRGVDFFTKFTHRFSFHLFDNVDISKKDNPRQASDPEEITVEKIIKYSTSGDLSALRRLKAESCDLASGDYDRRTPLHLAASNGHFNVVKFLLDRIGIDCANPVDRWHGTPYDDALREQHVEVAEYLQSMGGKSGQDLRNSGD